jgi:adsorption protein B
VTNVIAIMAGRRAVFAYAGTLFGRAAEWDKTPHYRHPVKLAAEPGPFPAARVGSQRVSGQ